MTATLTAPAATTTSPSTLLRCGIAAGPLFLLVSAAQAATRDGFDLTRHPLSLLSLGEPGWIQIANFVLSGALFVAGAIGVRRSTDAVWAARMLAVFGISLIWAGIFVADPAYGFGGPDVPSTTHGILHNVSPVLGFVGLLVACIALGRRLGRQGRRGWARYSFAVAAALILPDLAMGQSWYSLALALSGAVGWTWVSAVTARLLADSR